MLHILLVDDNPNDRLIAIHGLRRTFAELEIVSAVDNDSLQQALSQGGFDLAITDYQLHWSDGLKVLEAVKAIYPDCPVIMFTDSGSEEVAVQGMKAGLSDYVLKGRNHLHRLSIAVRECLEKQKLRQEYANAVEKLRFSEENLRFALEAGNIIAYSWDIQTGTVHRLQNGGIKTGLEPDGAVGSFEQILNAIHPEDRDRFQAKIRTALKLKTPYESEYRILQADGSVTWLYDKGRPTFDESGKPVQMFGIAMDITARKQAEEERSRAEAKERRYLNRLKQLTAASPLINSTLSLDEILRLIADKSREIIEAHMAIVHLTLDGNWADTLTKISLSEKYAQWRGYQASLDGSGIYTLVCQMQQPMRLTQAELKVHPAWCSFGKAARKHPPLRGWLAAPLRFRNGKSLGVIQLSDKYEGEFTEEDENILVQLAQMAAAAIDNAQLYEESQQANRVKDEFLAILSHELRSPLNAILGWSQILLSHKLEPAATTRALEIIERNARLQTQLIEDLLDVSRIIRSKLRLSVCSVNLTVPIEAAIDTMRLAAQSKSIDLLFTILDSGLGDSSENQKFEVLGDVNRLQQVVWNLLSNAIKFTPPGGRIEIRLERVGSDARITISDTGKGISPEFLPYIFDYFRQADGSTTRTHSGLGLGLAIVRHIIELHGGTISAESPGEGQGATFTIRLPLLKAETQEDTATQRNGETALREGFLTQASTYTLSGYSDENPKDDAVAESFCASSSASLTGLRILIVDDESDTREFLTFLLEQHKAKPMAVASATEALQALNTFKPTILISDIGMPNENGYSLLRKIRKLAPEKGGQIPAIALTAYAREEDKNQAMSAGFQFHIAKPVKPTELVAAILDLIGERGKGKGEWEIGNRENN
ncbi:hybrid sensor histidine kinase/response regulator [Fischerella sp. PCC 9605]|uniref:hybrid sensor histidine kinase/response regulator n=1 Tax=Fischerella sp. PCC 9605 TaxID=1173024 RepID=UPI0004AF0CEB|nr:response regulator [Fischerella sp. PCC 9605]